VIYYSISLSAALLNATQNLTKKKWLLMSLAFCVALAVLCFLVLIFLLVPMGGWLDGVFS
jgi:hypothetical protein